MARILLAIALTLPIVLGCSSDPSSTCPPGSERDDDSGNCVEDEAFVAAVHEEIGTGAYGYAYLIVGNCQPGSSSNVKTSYPSEVEVFAYEFSDVELDYSVGQNVLIPGAVPDGATTTDSDGSYRVQLAPGEYYLSGIDPISNELMISGTVNVAEGEVGRVLLYFDHCPL